MNRETLKTIAAHGLLSVTLCLVSAAAQAQAAAATGSSGSMSKASMPAGSSGTGDMKAAMTAGMDSMQKMPISGDTDKDFAMMMKAHHQQALDMAQMELSQGKSAEMKAMAKKIISAQKKEIAEFDRWLAKHK